MTTPSPASAQTVVTVSRRIEAPAPVIFALLADPRRHVDLDGSGMLRGAVTDAPVSSVGDVFVMGMHHEALDAYEMNNHVISYEADRLIGWEPVAGRGHPSAGHREGHRWSFGLTPDGPSATVVTESYDCTRTSEQMQAAVLNGSAWVEAMAKTLERLDFLCTGKP
jgi:hypothetical protein